MSLLRDEFRTLATVYGEPDVVFVVTNTSERKITVAIAVDEVSV